MLRPPAIVWFCALLLLGAGLFHLGASAWEALAVGEEQGSYIPWVVVGAMGLFEILCALLVPMAARWSTGLSWMVSGGAGVVAVAAGLSFGLTGPAGLSPALFAGLASLGACFFCFVALFFVHQYQSELEELTGY